MIGTFVLFMSFISFNAGSSLRLASIFIGAKIAVNTCLCAAAACFTAMAIQRWVWRYDLDLSAMLDGLLAGAVTSKDH